VTLETEQVKGGSLSPKIGTKFSYAKFNVDKGQVKADGSQVLETSLKVSPDIKLSFKTTKGADLGIDYTKGNFYATGVLDVANLSKISTSACLGLPSGIKVGGDASYALSGSAGLTGFNIGASYGHGPVFASLTATSKFSQYNLGVTYSVNPSISLASQTTHSTDKPFDLLAVGASYKDPAIGTIKAKVGSNGVVHACLVKELVPKVTLTASGSMSATDPSTFKPGIGISF